MLFTNSYEKIRGMRARFLAATSFSLKVLLIKEADGVRAVRGFRR